MCSSITVVISRRLAAYLAKKGYSAIPMDTVDYISKIVNDILTRRRQRVERRNDFIQIMLDHEEAVKDEEKTKELIEANKEQGTILKKSTPLN